MSLWDLNGCILIFAFIVRLSLNNIIKYAANKIESILDFHNMELIFKELMKNFNEIGMLG